jgi:hypothetical protein|uniref:hypothetical protein n=1 Tax=Prevotella sp. TaxID=59823 RepID=UPI002059AB3B|nr:hypothetical protein [Prevotella sp.]DAT31277.1 MAG TPA: putative transposon-related DNA-binding protein [Caudoviricetes sp.]
MFNGNLIARLIKEQRKQVGDMVAYVFGGNSHISKTYFKNRTSIDSKYLEKLSAFFQVPIQDFFLTDEEFEDRESQTNVHHITNSTVNINSSPDVLMGVIENQKKMIDQQASEITWLRSQFELLTASLAKQ